MSELGNYSDLTKEELIKLLKKKTKIIEKKNKIISEKSRIIQKQENATSKAIDSLTTTTEKLVQKNSELTSVLNTYSEISNDFRRKMSAINILFEYIKTESSKEFMYSFEPYVHGSFIRQFFELPFSLDCNLTQVSPIGRDIDIVLNPDSRLKNTQAEKIYEYIIKKFSNTNSTGLKILDYKECTITKALQQSTYEYETPGKIALQDIPHYKFMFCYQGYNFEIDIIMIEPIHSDLWHPIDFDVNDIRMSDKGLSTMKGVNNITLLNSIKSKNSISDINIQQLHDLGLENPSNYISLFLQIVFFLVERLKILEVGYTVESKYLLPNIRKSQNAKGECPEIETINGEWINFYQFTRKILDNEKVELKFENNKLYFELSKREKFISDDNKIEIRKMINESSVVSKIDMSQTKKQGNGSYYSNTNSYGGGYHY